MSAFSESTLVKKLHELNSSQQSIQTLSLWLIHHRRNHVPIVQTWMREFDKVAESKKLTYIYLANDVIQNSKKKGPEYTLEFSKVLPKVFTTIGLKHPALIKSLNRILDIWQERTVYKAETIEDYRMRLLNVSLDDNSKIAAEIIDGVENALAERKAETKQAHKRKSTTTPNVIGAPSSGSKSRSRSSSRVSEVPEKKSARGASTTHSAVRLSPSQIPVGDPPEPEELLKALTSLENAASSDVEVRERIANLPPEITDMSCLSKSIDAQTGRALSKQINDAVDLISNYNIKLAKEMEERTKVAVMLRDYHAEQVALLAQAEKRLEEYKKKEDHIVHVQKEISAHLNNLPDLTQLPDVTTGGLAPLPSAGDLFNIR